MTEEPFARPFTRGELLALPSSDVADLLGLVEGVDVVDRAYKLGFNLLQLEDRIAVLRATEGTPEPYSPPIGSLPDGVRSNLTPAVPEDRSPSLDVVDQDLSVLGTMGPSPEVALDIAAMMDRSVETGEPFLAGTFAMYAAPDGSVWMVTEGIGDGIRRSQVPRKWVRAALQLVAGEGGLKAKMLGKIFGG